MRIGIFVSGFGSSFALPDWTSDSLEGVASLSVTIQAMTESELAIVETPDEGYDIVSAYCENIGGIPSRIFEGIGYKFDELFSLFLNKYDIAPVSAYCVKDIPLLWMQRPAWYFPTKTEIVSARECFGQGLELISFCEEWSQECELFERGLIKLGRALYSQTTEEYLRMENKPVLEVQTGFVKFVQNHPWLMELVEHAYLSESAPRDPQERKQAFWIVDSMEHADAYLDRIGYSAHSLMVWSALLNNIENDSLSAKVIAQRPEGFFDAHEMRIMSYFRSMIQNRSEYFGSHPLGPFLLQLWDANNEEGRTAISECLPIQDRSASRFANSYEIGQLFGNLERSGLADVYSCLTEGIMDRRVQLLSEEAPDFADNVASFLFMIKVSHDTLAQVNNRA